MTVTHGGRPAHERVDRRAGWGHPAEVPAGRLSRSWRSGALREREGHPPLDGQAASSSQSAQRSTPAVGRCQSWWGRAMTSAPQTATA